MRQSNLKGWFLVFQWFGIAAAIALLLYYTFNHEYFRAVNFVIVTCLLWAFGRVVPTYEIGDEGIRYTDGHKRLHYRWSDIEWYFVQPMGTVPGIEQVIFKVKRAKLWNYSLLFTFDAQEVDKSALLRILEDRLPGKELSNQLMQEQAFNGPTA